MRPLKRFLIIGISLILLLSAFYLFWLAPRYVVPILMYHRFGRQQGALFVTPENFQQQMAYLKDKDYNVISLDELVEGIKNNRRFKRNTAVITVDDGYRDNYTYAYPILKKYGFPATIFIIANSIDAREDFLTWNQIRQMYVDNISFGCHTKNHVYIPSIEDRQALWDETSGCRQLMEDKLGEPVNYFCYPFGGFTEETKAVLKQAGYKGACSTNRGFAELNKDVYELKRVKVTNSDTNKPLHFWAKLSGYYNIFRTRKSGRGD